MTARRHRAALLLLALAPLAACAPRRPEVALFSAAAFEPVLHALRPAAEAALGVRIRAETGGSGNLVRRVAELGRACDLLVLADPALFREAGGGRFTWRITFAGDEMVLGVGVRAPRADDAERDWAAVLDAPGVRLIRADEKISPAGARTLTVWSRREAAGAPGLRERLLRTALVADDVGTIAAHLKTGTADYAFLYRSSCLLHELRYIRLEPPYRLADEAERPDPEAIRYALSIPIDAPRPQEAEALLRFFLVARRERWADGGFIPLRPRFYGSRDNYARFRAFADYGGPF